MLSGTMKRIDSKNRRQVTDLVYQIVTTRTQIVKNYPSASYPTTLKRCTALKQKNSVEKVTIR
jgi:hypothetical protein